MSWTFTDFFCGFGGSSIGMTEAGGELVWAAKTKGAGNAVASNVAHYLGVIVGRALGTPMERVA